MVDGGAGTTETAGDGSAQDSSAQDESVLSSQRRSRVEAKARSARVALAHDWLVGRRGGEAVLERIARIVLQRYTHAGLYTLFKKGKGVGSAIDRFDCHTSMLNGLPGRRWLLPMYPAAVGGLSAKLARHAEASPIDLLVSTSSGLIKGMKAPEGARHLCYCHAPARYLWSVTDDYTRGGVGGTLRKIGFGAFGERLKSWDRKTVSNVDSFVANSRHTAKEIDRCFGREAVVIHPPVRTEMFTVDPAVKREDFWLVAGAHEPYKRTDIAIEAAMRAGKRLMVAGGGSEIGALKAFTKKTARSLGKMGFGTGRQTLVEFLGRVDDATLIGLYRRARCLIYPQIEDFGIVAVEAQACGCPVVARRAGGALDSVLEGRTGVFFNDADPLQVIAAVERAPEGVDEQCRAHAEKFSEAAFDRRIAKAMGRMV